MVKMILADDEPIITNGIQKLVDWERLGIEIIGQYEDGRHALEGMIRQEPDLALLDVVMPGMTGVEILKECQALGLKTKIIFISGFQDFEYAKAALKYGAVDYLLKPVIREELLRAVGKFLSEQPSVNREETDLLEEKKEKWMIDYKRLVELENTKYIPAYAEIIYQLGENTQMKKLIRFSLISFLEEYLTEKQIGITFTKGEYIVVVFKGLGLETCKEAVVEMWEAAVSTTRHQVGFVIGEMVPNMGGIPQAFKYCLEMKEYFFFADQMKLPVLRTGEQVFTKRVDNERFEKTREEMLNAVIGQELKIFEQYFKQFVKLVCWLSDGKKEDACFYFCTALRMIENKFEELRLPGRGLDMKKLLEDGRNCSSYGEMVKLYGDIFQEYLSAIQSTVVNNDKKDILKALDYIEKHYCENLSLGDLAEEIHMNPYYFSTFFKKSMGENFKDYLNKIRIRKAVSLLISTDMKTYEIAREVGFGDARIFSNNFQRFYHETPNAYRKRISLQNKNHSRK